MAPTTAQSLENHARFVPAYHGAVFGIFFLNLLWSLYRMVQVPGIESAISLLLAVAFILLAFYARVFALTVQDRVIRLEMRLRLGYLLPPDMQNRIGDFTPAQLVALRFAS